jgi:hypothetical protein
MVKPLAGRRRRCRLAANFPSVTFGAEPVAVSNGAHGFVEFLRVVAQNNLGETLQLVDHIP